MITAFKKSNDKNIAKIKANANKDPKLKAVNKGLGRYSTLRTKTALKSKSTLKSNTQLKSNSILKGSAIGSFHYKSEQKAKKAKKKLKGVLIEKRKLHGLTLKAAEEKAIRTCHTYIRLRDYGKPCICCGRDLGPNYNAGHFKEAGNNTAIKLDENNIHGQRNDCNTIGNGDSGDYDKNIRIRVGDTVTDNLIAQSKLKVITRLEIEDYLKIIDYYEKLIVALEEYSPVVPDRLLVNC
jgi:hypothetical protein